MALRGRDYPDHPAAKPRMPISWQPQVERFTATYFQMRLEANIDGSWSITAHDGAVQVSGSVRRNPAEFPFDNRLDNARQVCESVAQQLHEDGIS